MKKTFLDLVRERPALLDGGMGTELMKSGLPEGIPPERWNVDNPEAVSAVHAAYFEAGSDAVLTNTFGANRIKLAGYGDGKHASLLNREAARLARRIVPEGAFLGGSMGPTGKFLRPQGEFAEQEFEDAFAEQAEALTEGGVDFLHIETQYDLREALTALRGARKASPLPVFVTLTFNNLRRGFFTLMGNGLRSFVDAMESEGVPAIGANCTINSEEMAGLIRDLRGMTKLPLIAKANAGKPDLARDGTVSYSQGLEEYIRFIPEIVAAGANIIGGCCGTSPEYIRRIAKIVKS